jgi:hypothetical protein
LTEEQNTRRVDWRDVTGLLGIALITGGTAMIYVPAALIVCGSLFLSGAILMARRS